jgi:hypothetical protein
MRDVVTSVNTWLKSELPDVNFVYERGSASGFPAVVVTCETVGETGEKRCSETLLCEAKLNASVITNNGDSFTARDIASRIVKALTGNSDRPVRIPMYGWDYESVPPAPTCTVFEMEVGRIEIVDTFDVKNPELRNVRVDFGLRTRL